MNVVFVLFLLWVYLCVFFIFYFLDLVVVLVAYKEIMICLLDRRQRDIG
jgi:hypothetical protein